jgi:hypothetical protein
MAILLIRRTGTAASPPCTVQVPVSSESKKTHNRNSDLLEFQVSIQVSSFNAVRSLRPNILLSPVQRGTFNDSTVFCFVSLRFVLLRYRPPFVLRFHSMAEEDSVEVAITMERLVCKREGNDFSNFKPHADVMTTNLAWKTFSIALTVTSILMTVMACWTCSGYSESAGSLARASFGQHVILRKDETEENSFVILSSHHVLVHVHHF